MARPASVSKQTKHSAPSGQVHHTEDTTNSAHSRESKNVEQVIKRELSSESDQPRLSQDLPEITNHEQSSVFGQLRIPASPFLVFNSSSTGNGDSVRFIINWNALSEPMWNCHAARDLKLLIHPHVNPQGREDEVFVRGLAHLYAVTRLATAVYLPESVMSGHVASSNFALARNALRLRRPYRSDTYLKLHLSSDGNGIIEDDEGPGYESKAEVKFDARATSPSDEGSMIYESIEQPHLEPVQHQQQVIKSEDGIQEQDDTSMFCQHEEHLKHLSMLLGMLMSILDGYDTWNARLMETLKQRQLSVDEDKEQVAQWRGTYDDSYYITRELLGEMAPEIDDSLQLSG